MIMRGGGVAERRPRRSGWLHLRAEDVSPCAEPLYQEDSLATGGDGSGDSRRNRNRRRSGIAAGAGVERKPGARRQREVTGAFGGITTTDGRAQRGDRSGCHQFWRGRLGGGLVGGGTGLRRGRGSLSCASIDGAVFTGVAARRLCQRPGGRMLDGSLLLDGAQHVARTRDVGEIDLGLDFVFAMNGRAREDFGGDEPDSERGRRCLRTSSAS